MTETYKQANSVTNEWVEKRGLKGEWSQGRREERGVGQGERRMARDRKVHTAMGRLVGKVSTWLRREFGAGVELLVEAVWISGHYIAIATRHG